MTEARDGPLSREHTKFLKLTKFVCEQCCLSEKRQTKKLSFFKNEKKVLESLERY